MLLLRLCLFVCVNLFLYAKCSIPVEKLCADPSCTKAISEGIGKVQYPAADNTIGFRKGQEITIISKGKNKGDYWGAIVNGKYGYVPAELVQERKVYVDISSLIKVSVTDSHQNVAFNSSETRGAEQLLKTSNTNEKPIEPAKTFDVIEGTTIYNDEITPSATVDVKSTPHTVAPANPKINKDTVPQQERPTILPESTSFNSNSSEQKLGNSINLTVDNVTEKRKNTILESKDIQDEEDDEGEGEGEDGDEEEDDEEEEDEEGDIEDEENNFVEEQIKKGLAENEIKPPASTIAPNKKVEDIVTSSTQSIVSGIVETLPSSTVENSVTSQVSMSVGDAKMEAGQDVKMETSPQGAPNSWSMLNSFGGQPQVDALKQQQQPGSLDLNAKPQAIISEPTMPEQQIKAGLEATQKPLANVGLDQPMPVESPKPVGSGFETINQQNAGEPIVPTPNVGTGFETTGPYLSQPVAAATPFEASVVADTTPHYNQQKAGEPTVPTPMNIESGFIPSGPYMSQQLAAETPKPGGEDSQTPAGTQKQGEPTVPTPIESGFTPTGPYMSQPVVSETPKPVSSGFETQTAGEPTVPPPITVETVPYMSQPMAGGTPKPVVPDSEAATAQVVQQTSPEVPSVHGDQFPNAVTPPAISEGGMTTDTPKLSPEESSTIFSQFSVSADALPEEAKNTDKPLEPDMIPEKVEVTTESLASTGNQWSVPEKKEEAITEAWPTPEVVTEKGEVKTETENTFEQPPVDPNPQTDEQPGMLAQITGMFSSWFPSTPGEELSEDKSNHEATYENVAFTERTETTGEAPPGTCQNPDSGFDCKDFASGEEQGSSWMADYLPQGLGLDNVLTQSNTLLYLIVTAVTVLFFTLGHNFIEKRGKTAPLIAKINKLEHELLVATKECVLLKDEIQSARDKIILYETSANDELVITLQTELEESKKIRTELESSIEILQQELDAATEAGLDLNKMLSEVLTQKGGSESLLKSVESLQAQLDSQQKVIDEMTKKLGVKNQENEALQSALDAANEKSDNLEEELTDIKHNLNLHLKEKEDLMQDLNSQINQLKTSSSQLGETKEKEISKLKKQIEELQKKLKETGSGFTVKEEEVKQLKESMKHLKTKGDVKLETVFDVSRVKAELAKEKKDNQDLLEKLQKDESSRKGLMEQVKQLEGEIQDLKKKYEEAEQKRDEAEKKLEVLSTYFKEKETQLQKELGLQEALWAQKKGDEKAVYNMMKSLQEEVESYKSQNETLKKEILDQERGLKNQMAGLEQKAHENWVAARQAERKLEETKQELAQLRNRLTLMEKNSNNVDGKGSLRSEELNGVEAASPILHDTSSPLLFPPLPLDPNNSKLLPPGFMPPPMFIPPPMGGFMPPPPFLPGDRRPPPLGRMSSPPLNNRFSPSSDYSCTRMSSPPLSPSASNYRSLNQDREHYRHRTPPYPPPLHPRNWDDSNEMPGFIPISSQRESSRDHKGSDMSSERSSSE